MSRFVIEFVVWYAGAGESINLVEPGVDGLPPVGPDLPRVEGLVEVLPDFKPLDFPAVSTVVSVWKSCVSCDYIVMRHHLWQCLSQLLTTWTCTGQHEPVRAWPAPRPTGAPSCWRRPAASSPRLRPLTSVCKTEHSVKSPGSLIHIFNKQFICLPGLPACILSIHHRCWIEAIKMPFKAGPGSLIDADDECRAGSECSSRLVSLVRYKPVVIVQNLLLVFTVHLPACQYSLHTKLCLQFEVKKIFIECQNIKKVQNILKKKCIWIYCPLCVVTALRRDSFVSAQRVLPRDGTIVRVPAHSHHHPRHQDRDRLQHHPPSNLLSGFWR